MLVVVLPLTPLSINYCWLVSPYNTACCFLTCVYTISNCGAGIAATVPGKVQGIPAQSSGWMEKKALRQAVLGCLVAGSLQHVMLPITLLLSEQLAGGPCFKVTGNGNTINRGRPDPEKWPSLEPSTVTEDMHLGY